MQRENESQSWQNVWAREQYVTRPLIASSNQRKRASNVNTLMLWEHGAETRKGLPTLTGCN